MTIYKITLTNRTIANTQVTYFQHHRYGVQLKITAPTHNIVGSCKITVSGSEQSAVNGTFDLRENGLNTLQSIDYDQGIAEGYQPKNATGTIITVANQTYFDIQLDGTTERSIGYEVPNEPMPIFGTNAVVKFQSVEDTIDGTSPCYAFYNRPGTSADLAINYSDAGGIFSQLKNTVKFRVLLTSADGNPTDPTANVPVVLRV